MTIDWTAAANGESGPSAWDILRLAGEVVPGIAHVESESPDGRDKQKARGAKRSRTRQKGRAGVKFRISVEMLPGEADDFRERILPLIYSPAKSAEPGAVSIEHPAAAFWGVAEVTIGSIKLPPPQSGGTLTVSLDADEFVEEPAAVKNVAPEPQSDGGQPAAPPPTLAEQALGNSFSNPFVPFS